VELAQAHTDEALEALVKALAGPQSVAAACAILDRGWGKPSQSIDAVVTTYEGGIDTPKLPRGPEGIEEWLERRRKELSELTAKAPAPQRSPPIVTNRVEEPAPPPMPPAPPPKPDTIWTPEQERAWQRQEAEREQSPGLHGPLGQPGSKARW
jgi:hypothetical protein